VSSAKLSDTAKIITAITDANNSVDIKYHLPRGRHLHPHIIPGHGLRDERAASSLQRPRPRPFYCALYNDTSSFGVIDEFGFFKMPDAQSTALTDIYVSPQWTWSE